MNKGHFTAPGGRRPAVPDKVDMSLDDIIRLNKKEQQLKRRQATVNRRPVKKKGRFTQGKGVPSVTAGPVQKGGGVPRGGAPKLRNRRVPPPPGRRRGQGVITGLAARRPAALLKRVGTLNRAAINQKTRQKTKPFIQRTEAPYRKPEVQRRPYRQPDPQRGQNATAVRRPFQLRRRPLPPVQQTQREARQATFLFHRGIKVQAQVQKPNPRSPPVRTRQWRTSTTSNGILTVSIDNPTARTQPEPPSAWTLHPPAAIAAPVKVETVEKKIPKGVPLQFDINSVGKPTKSCSFTRNSFSSDSSTASPSRTDPDHALLPPSTCSRSSGPASSGSSWFSLGANTKTLKAQTVLLDLLEGREAQENQNQNQNQDCVGQTQTSITLNERFRILKDQRTTTAQGSKGSRFVTVG